MYQLIFSQFLKHLLAFFLIICNAQNTLYMTFVNIFINNQLFKNENGIIDFSAYIIRR
jgi:hypothetical protein